MAGKLLIIEDEEGLVLTLCDRLESENYQIDKAVTGLDGLRLGKEGKYDVILLDIMLPGLDGISVCKELRRCGISTPIMMLTAKGQLDDKVLGLSCGADDYLSKPFEMAELLARISALIRRTEIQKKVVTHLDVTDDDLVLDLKNGILYKENKQIHLLTKEVKLLEYLYSKGENVISREELLKAVWKYESGVSTRTVDVHVARLRRKFGDIGIVPKYIQTVRGVGYKFNPPKMI